MARGDIEVPGSSSPASIARSGLQAVYLDWRSTPHIGEERNFESDSVLSDKLDRTAPSVHLSIALHDKSVWVSMCVLWQPMAPEFGSTGRSAVGRPTVYRKQ